MPEPDMMAALEESLRDKFVCATCGRKFVSADAAAGHLDKRGPTWGADGYGIRFCRGTAVALPRMERD